MKFFGEKVEGPKDEIIVIPRGDNMVVFTAKAVLSYDVFDELCKEPKAPMVMDRKAGTTTFDTSDIRYKQQLDEHYQKRSDYMIITSLEDTEGLEWELVDKNDPDTWKKYTKEFQDSGFTQAEINMIMTGVMTANSMDEEKMKEARARFFRTREEQVEA